MHLKEKYPNLTYFFSCYLYQCAVSEHGSLEGAVNEFTVSEPTEKIEHVLQELRLAISNRINRASLIELGSYYVPQTEEEVGPLLVNLEKMLLK